MKIVQIFPGKVWGGAEQYVLDLGTALTAGGHEVTYIARPSKAVSSRLDGRIDYTTAPMGGLTDRRSARILAPIVGDADIVHVHDLEQVRTVMAAIDRSGSRARVVLTRHVARASRTMPWHRSALRRLHSMIFISRLGMELWRSVNSWMEPERCRVIHNSIPPYTPEATESLRERYGLSADTPLLMFTGRVRASKGCKILVEALGRLKDLKWMMVFVGTCKPADFDKELLETAREMGIADRIGFTGFSTKVRSLIRQADAGIAPSIVREAWGLSPMEFMQAGVCTIATDNGAQPEYITDGTTGLLVAPANVAELAEKLRAILTDLALRSRIGAAGKEYFDTAMSYDRFIAEILSAYEA